MGDEKQPPQIWKIRRGSIRRKWMVPFVRVEWSCERISFWLSQWAFLEVLEYIGKLSLVAALLTYILLIPERRRNANDQRKAKQYQAWQILYLAQGRGGNGGKIAALQDLLSDGVSLSGINLDGSFLHDLELTNAILTLSSLRHVGAADINFESSSFQFADLSDADLQRANFRNAKFWRANLREAILDFSDLENVDLDDADLTGASFRGVTNWNKIRSLKGANIYGIKDAESEFLEWATNRMGAVCIPIKTYELWLDSLMMQDEKEARGEHFRLKAKSLRGWMRYRAPFDKLSSRDQL